MIWFCVAVFLGIVVIVMALCKVSSINARMEESQSFNFILPEVTPVPMPEETAAPAVHKAWARYDVPLDDELQRYIIQGAQAHEISPCIVFAVIGEETGGTYDPTLVGDGGNSFGLMQVYRSEHTDRMARLGAWDLLDPYQNVDVGIDILAELIAYYDGDMDRALSFYHGNGGDLPDEYAYTVQRNAECLLESVQIVTE